MGRAIKSIGIAGGLIAFFGFVGFVAAASLSKYGGRIFVAACRRSFDGGWNSAFH